MSEPLPLPESIEEQDADSESAADLYRQRKAIEKRINNLGKITWEEEMARIEQKQESKKPQQDSTVDAEDILAQADAAGNVLIRIPGEAPMSAKEILSFIDAGMTAEQISELERQTLYQVAEKSVSDIDKLISKVRANPKILDSL